MLLFMDKMVSRSKLAVVVLTAVVVVFTNCEVLEGNPSLNSQVRLIDLVDVSPCGGLGQVTEIRIPHCTTFPCPLKLGDGYLAEVDFIPAQSHREDLQVDAVLTTMNKTQIPVFSHGPFDMKITKGYTYTLTYEIELPLKLALGNASLQFSFFGSSDVKEVCVDLLGMFVVQ